MINFVTNREYTGMNYDTLARLSKGSEFAGFHQCKKFFGVKGTDLKGMKAAASVTVSYTHLTLPTIFRV